MSVRIESTGMIAHADVRGGITACGVMYSTAIDPWPFSAGTESADPVDCMSCLVQESRDATDRFIVSFGVSVINVAAVNKINFVSEEMKIK